MSSSPAQRELFAVPCLPACALCGSRGLNKACLRCRTSRQRYYQPVPAEQLAALNAAIAARHQADAARRQQLEELLQHQGRPLRLALVGCGKAKRSTAAPARELYTGSLFRSAWRYAQATADQVLILSAQHGVLSPDEVLEPYDSTLTTMRRADRDAWASRCALDLRARFAGLPVHVVFLAGEAYRLALPAAWSVESPLDGLGLGRRLACLASLNLQLRKSGTTVPSQPHSLTESPCV